MNKNRYLIALLAVFAIFFAGCGSDDEELAKKDDTGGTEELGCKLLNNREIGRTGGTFYWAVKAGEPWTLDAGRLADWLTIEPLEGKAGTTGVTLNIDTLLGGEARTLELPFVVGGKEVKITVRQTLEDEGEKDEMVCRFLDKNAHGVEGGEILRTLQASEAWTLTTTDSWLSVSPLSGDAGSTELTLTAEASGGNIRVAVLTFTFADTVIELPVIQGLNQTKPQLTTPEEAVVTDNLVKMSGKCIFENDELVIAEVGFAYKLQGTDDEWTYLPAEAAITSGEFDFTAEVQLEWGTTYVYKPYAKINEDISGGEEKTFAIDNRVIADGVWYYENFDGMYDPETGTYKKKVNNNYEYYNVTSFDADGGFLRKNQATAKYALEMDDPTGNACYLSMASSEAKGRLSAQIHAPDVPGIPGLEPGTQLYSGASGNWKVGINWKKNWKLIITGLNFEGAGTLQLTFGCASPTGSDRSLKGLKVYTSVDGGKTWDEVTCTVGAPANFPSQQWWKLVTVDNLSDNITAIRILLNADNKGGSMALDDIKVVAQP